MKGLFVGLNPDDLETATLSVRLRDPEARVLVATEIDHGFRMAESEEPDLVMIQADRGDDGLCDQLRSFRRAYRVPIVVWGSEDGEMEPVRVLEAGADDYVRTPFSVMELVARINALMRRVSYANGDHPGSLAFADRLLIRPATYEVYLDGKRLNLTLTEFRLLHILAAHRQSVASHAFLEEVLWNDRYQSGALVKKYVQRLRRKLEDDPNAPSWIASVHGVGYRFVGEPSLEPALEPLEPAVRSPAAVA